MRAVKRIATALFFALCGVSAQAQIAVTENGHFADVNGARIYYEERGSGEPLLLLHNFFNTAASWEAYVDDLATRYRVIAWDMRGHGRSNNPSTSEHFLHEDAAHDLLVLMDHLGIDRARAVGASSGGMTLLYAATMRPDRFEALVLIGVQTYYSSKARTAVTELSNSLDADPEPLNTTHGASGAQRLRRQFRAMASQYGDPSFTSDLLATISARALVVQGDNDRFIPIEQPLEMFLAIPRAHLWIVPNGGHLPHLVPENRDDLLRRVTEFLGGEWEEGSR